MRPHALKSGLKEHQGVDELLHSTPTNEKYIGGIGAQVCLVKQAAKPVVLLSMKPITLVATVHYKQPPSDSRRRPRPTRLCR